MIMCAVGRNGRRIPDPEVQWTRGRFSAMEVALMQRADRPAQRGLKK